MACICFEKKGESSHTRDNPQYKALHVSTGRAPNGDVCDELGATYECISMECAHAKMSLLHAFESLDETNLHRRGIGWNQPLIQDYLRSHVICATDKDSSFVVMSTHAYICELKHNMNLHHPNGNPVYKQLAKTGYSHELLWLNQARAWQHAIHELLVQSVPLTLHDMIRKYVDAQRFPTLANFYRFVKSHKEDGLLFHNEHWKSRPVVGLCNWATTSVSKLLAILGDLLLRLDNYTSPSHSSLRDTLDFVHRLGEFCEREGQGVDTLRSSSLDFSSLYTNFVWKDIRQCYVYWRDFWTRHAPSLQGFTTEEREFASWFFEERSVEFFLPTYLSFSYSSHPSQLESRSLGEFMLHLVFEHVIFKVPSLGIFKQNYGFPMGTNMAAPWANLSVRYYMATCPVPLPSRSIFLRFLDDGFGVYHKHDEDAFHATLTAAFPAHLSFSYESKGMTGGVAFLDVFILHLQPLHHCTYFKKSQSCHHTPWTSNTSHQGKSSWITGETVRYLRTCSHEAYFMEICKRLQFSCTRLRYPTHTYHPQPLSWKDKSKYMHRKPRKSLDAVHAFRFPFHCSSPLQPTHTVRTLESCVRPHIPNLRLFVTFPPPPNLRRRFHRQMLNTLNALGEDEPNTQDLLCDIAGASDDSYV